MHLADVDVRLARESSVGPMSNGVELEHAV
jgi:hypothetical protein